MSSRPRGGVSGRGGPDAVVFHKFKQPIAKPGDVPAYLHYFITRNYLLLWRKLPRPYFMRKAMLWFLYQRLSQMARMRDVPSAVDAVLSGLWDGVRGVGGPYQADRRPPWLLRIILGRRPEFWLAVLNLQFASGATQLDDGSANRDCLLGVGPRSAWGRVRGRPTLRKRFDGRGWMSPCLARASRRCGGCRVAGVSPHRRSPRPDWQRPAPHRRLALWPGITYDVEQTSFARNVVATNSP